MEYSPEVEKIKDFCESFNQKGAIIFFVDDVQMSYAFYGNDDDWWEFMRKFSDKLYDYIEKKLSLKRLMR